MPGRNGFQAAVWPMIVLEYSRRALYVKGERQVLGSNGARMGMVKFKAEDLLAAMKRALN